MLVFLAFRGRVRDLKVKIIAGCVEQPFRRRCPLSSGHVFVFESSRKTRRLESPRCRLKACSTIALRTGTLRLLQLARKPALRSLSCRAPNSPVCVDLLAEVRSNLIGNAAAA